MTACRTGLQVRTNPVGFEVDRPRGVEDDIRLDGVANYNGTTGDDLPGGIAGANDRQEVVRHGRAEYANWLPADPHCHPAASGSTHERLFVQGGDNLNLRPPAEDAGQRVKKRLLACHLNLAAVWQHCVIAGGERHWRPNQIRRRCLDCHSTSDRPKVIHCPHSRPHWYVRMLGVSLLHCSPISTRLADG